MDIIYKLREEVVNRIELLEQQRGKHEEEIEKFMKKIEKADMKKKSLEEHLIEKKKELARLDEYLVWKKE